MDIQVLWWEKDMEVHDTERTVSPSHDYLYCIVQVSNGAVTANQQSSPDGWADLTKP